MGWEEVISRHRSSLSLEEEEVNSEVDAAAAVVTSRRLRQSFGVTVSGDTVFLLPVLHFIFSGSCFFFFAVAQAFRLSASHFEMDFECKY